MIIEVFTNTTIPKKIDSFYLSDVYYRNDEYIESQIVKRYPWINQKFPYWDYKIKGEQFTPILAV